jgi:tetratricopeptide (TPR) repeat protein
VKLFVILSFTLLLWHQGAAQSLESVKEVTALKQKLPNVRGGEKLDYLNSITEYYYQNYPSGFDSTVRYAKLAYEQSARLNNKWKEYRAARFYAKILLQCARADEGFKYYTIAVRIANELNIDNLKAVAYRGLGEALWYQGNFEKAVDTIKRSIIYFQRVDSWKDVADAKMVISNIYGDHGNYGEAFEASLEALKVSENLGDEDNIVLSLTQLGDLYQRIGDYETSLDYYRKGLSYEPHPSSWCYRHLHNCMGDLFCEMQKFDSAYLYIKRGMAVFPQGKTSRWRLAECYLLQKNYDSAFAYFKGLYDELKNTGEGNITNYAMLGMGKVFYAQHNLLQAMYFGKQALQQSEIKGTKQIIRDASKLLYSIHEELKQTDSAFLYFKKFVQVKDSIVTDQFKGKLYAFRKASQAEKDLKQIELLKQQKATGRRFTKILIGVIVLLALLTFIMFRNSKLRRKNEILQTARMQAEWQRRAGELEMQALRAQMNPHFIFNCLSSINKFILKNEADKASDYLTRFSRLIRLVLLNSQKPLIVLEEEVEMLRLYIEMEKLRFKNAFDYSITYTDEIEPANIYIPPLLLQPFCENAIWHGLMHKEGFGQLDISFAMKDNMVVCTITDNGIGRAKASEIKTKSAERIKSLGLTLTSERLALFNAGETVQTFYKMEDVVEDGAVAGTRVKINIRYQEGIEETVEKVTV